MIHGDIKQKEKTNTNIINNMINSTREWDWMDDNKLKDNNMKKIIIMPNGNVIENKKST